MKNFRSSLILVGVALLLGAYVFFFERGPVKKDEAKPKLFTQFVADDVKEMRFQNPAAPGPEKLIDIQKNAQDEWQIVAPRKLKADETEMRAILTSLGDASPDDTIPNPAQLSDYGLNTPSAQAVFTFKDGSRQTLMIGDKGMGGTSVYVKPSGQNDVYLVQNYITDNLTKSLDDLRDHSLIQTDLVQAGRVVVTKGGKTLELVKDKGGDWKLTKPISIKADTMKVRDVLTAVNDLRVDKFETDHPSDLKVYGLSPPSAVLEIGGAQSGAKDQVLYLGRDKLKTTDVFAQMKGSPTVFLLPQTFKKSLDLTPGDFKDKALLQFDASQAVRLTVTHEGKSVVYVKDAQGKWESIGRDKANDEGSGILSQLALLTITDFSPPKAKSGLAHPAYSVEVTFADQTAHRYEFGNRVQDKIYLSTNRNSEIYLVSASVAAPLEIIFSAPARASTPGSAAAPAAGK